MTSGRKPSLNPEQIQQALAQYNSGCKISDIAKGFEVCRATVLKYIRLCGERQERKGGALKRVTTAHAVRAKELRSQGVCWKLINRELDLSEDVLRKAIARMDKGEPV